MTFDLANPDPNPGDALRDEAANLLAAKYGRVEIEHRVQGKKADTYFKRTDFGKESRVYVEAKDKANRLTRDEVVGIWADYQGIIKNHAPSILLLITRSGLTADAQSYVQSEIDLLRHQTIWELENETLGLTEYVKSLTGLFAQDGLENYYIEARSRLVSYEANSDERTVAPNDTNIFEQIRHWISSSEHSPIAILGGYGAGKSTLAKRIISVQAHAALTDPHARRPLLIRLGNFGRYSSLEGLLGGMFTHDFPLAGFNMHQFMALNAKGRMLIVLDGFDEMKHAMTWADFRAQIADLNRLTTGSSKILLLGRPSAFISTEEHLHVLRGLKRFDGKWRRLPDWPEFQEFELQEFSPLERSDFVARYLTYRIGPDNEKSDWIKQRAQETNMLADRDANVFGKPVHAKILTDLASDPSVDLRKFGDGVSRWQLYQTFFESLTEREVDKASRRPIGEFDRLAFIREVAYWLWSQMGGATAFYAPDLPDSIVSQLSPGESADMDGLKREYLSGSLLEKKSGDTFYFGHRSFAEFLVAQRMVLKRPEGSDYAMYSSLVRDGVLLFLKEAPHVEAIKTWCDNIDNAEGTIYFEFFLFLSEMFGGLEKFIEALPPKSTWRELMKIFGGRLLIQDDAVKKLTQAALRQDNALFFRLVSLLQFITVSKDFSEEEFRALIAGLVLDRVFSKATVDNASQKAFVLTPTQDALKLAATVVPTFIRRKWGGGLFVFRGTGLMAAKAEHLRKGGADIAFQPPSPSYDLNLDIEIADTKVYAAMSARGRENAEEYYSRFSNLRDIFVRGEAPQSRRGRG